MPELHPAVFDTAATHRIRVGALPDPGPFFRALAKRVHLYDTVARLPE